MLTARALLLIPQVEELLSEEARETTSVSELKQQLQELQLQVADASEVRQRQAPAGKTGLQVQRPDRARGRC